MGDRSLARESRLISFRMAHPHPIGAVCSNLSAANQKAVASALAKSIGIDDCSFRNTRLEALAASAFLSRSALSLRTPIAYSQAMQMAQVRS